ncbi:hypothetical protein HDU93_001856, partial [Gonapodya sp. JEL0774]
MLSFLSSKPEPLSIVTPQNPPRKNESGIIRNKLTPPGTPLVSRFPSSPDVTTAWECFESALSRFGEDKKWIGEYDEKAKSYTWTTLGYNKKRILNVGSGLVAAGLKRGDRIGI